MRINVDLSVNDYDRDLFAERRIVLETRAGESMVHIVLKVLAMAMFHDPRLQVEPVMGDDDRFKPDLLIRHDDHRPALWVECGQCRVQKLDKVTFRYYDAKVVMLKRTEREAREIMERCRGQVRRLQAIEFIGFDNGFVEGVADALTGKNDIVAIISGNSLQVVVDGETYPGTIHRFHSDAP
ncbi:MAG: YaeQ family protein [Planctomycetes bacterium]|nr:YaeQ family protein [Planctomycetota bacterium]